jgi:hypothetical protein
LARENNPSEQGRPYLKPTMIKPAAHIAFVIFAIGLAACDQPRDGIECTLAQTTFRANGSVPPDDGKPFAMTLEFLPGGKFRVVATGKEIVGPMKTTETTYTFGDEDNITQKDGSGGSFSSHFSAGTVDRRTGDYLRSASGPNWSETVTGKCHAVRIETRL